MNLLIIGSGGREHALAWKAAQSTRVARVFVAPGNAGTALEPKVSNCAIAPTDVDALAAFAKQEQVTMTVVGTETALAAGVVDVFEKQGLRCLGPTQAAARLETSKAFSKDFMRRHQIPTAAFATFTDMAAARAYIAQHPTPCVIKADGLAAGKGVVIAHTPAQATTAAASMLEHGDFGNAGRRIVIEAFLTGEEASFIVLADGEHCLPLASAQDHKARLDGDRGPNTGGMGAYSPAPVITPAREEKILRTIIEPTLRGMAAEGTPYRGFLYAGVMISPDGSPWALEFNCRLGDPETQPLLMRLQTDWIVLCEAALDGRLDRMTATWSPQAALGVVLVNRDYPAACEGADEIRGLPQENGVDYKVFHAGTALKNGRVVTHGGRILCVTALGDTLAGAQKRAYAIADAIQWPHKDCRTDIGWRGLSRD